MSTRKLSTKALNVEGPATITSISTGNLTVSEEATIPILSSEEVNLSAFFIRLLSRHTSFKI